MSTVCAKVWLDKQSNKLNLVAVDSAFNSTTTRVRIGDEWDCKWLGTKRDVYGNRTTYSGHCYSSGASFQRINKEFDKENVAEILPGMLEDLADVHDAMKLSNQERLHAIKDFVEVCICHSLFAIIW